MAYTIAENETGLIDKNGQNIPIASGNRHFQKARQDLGNLITDNGDGTFSFSPDGVNLIDWTRPTNADLRAQACLDVDAAAGRARARHTTVSIGQDAIYVKKAEDAQAFADAGYPEASLVNYPFVQAEANALGVTGQEAADGIVAAHVNWVAKMAEIEQERIQGKADINSRIVANTINIAKETAIAALDAI